jgi:hypothetical protein
MTTIASTIKQCFTHLTSDVRIVHPQSVRVHVCDWVESNKLTLFNFCMDDMKGCRVMVDAIVFQSGEVRLIHTQAAPHFKFSSGMTPSMFM